MVGHLPFHGTKGNSGSQEEVITSGTRISLRGKFTSPNNALLVPLELQFDPGPFSDSGEILVTLGSLADSVGAEKPAGGAASVATQVERDPTPRSRYAFSPSSVEIPARVEFTLDFSFVQTGLVAGEVWYDLNRNGQKDSGENPGGNIRVVCSCGTDAVTTVDGTFILGDLLPGEVFLSIDLQGLPPLYEVVPKRVQVRVLSGRQVNGIRFALQPRERPVEEQTQPPQQVVRRSDK